MARKKNSTSGASPRKPSAAKSTELSDLPPSTDATEDVKGGRMTRATPTPTPTPTPACTTGLLSTCKVEDTKIDTWCGTNC